MSIFKVSIVETGGQDGVLPCLTISLNTRKPTIFEGYFSNKLILLLSSMENKSHEGKLFSPSMIKKGKSRL